MVITNTEVAFGSEVVGSYAEITNAEIATIQSLLKRVISLASDAATAGNVAKLKQAMIIGKAHSNHAYYVQILMLTSISEMNTTAGLAMVEGFINILGWRPILVKVVELLFIFDMFIDALTDIFPHDQFIIPTLFESSNAFIYKPAPGKVTTQEMQFKIKLTVMRDWEYKIDCCNISDSCSHGVSRQGFIIDCYAKSNIMNLMCY